MPILTGALAMPPQCHLSGSHLRANPPRPRLRDLGLAIGQLPTGPGNAITDVPDVRVGHVSLVKGHGELVKGKGPVRTGVTAVLPHGGDLFNGKVFAASHVINGFGKSIGLPQIDELGTIETPILITNTLNVGRVADALIEYLLIEKGTDTGSINPVVTECNDGYLNDVWGRHVGLGHVRRAIDEADTGPLAEGCVGAGVGMSCFGFKGGVGTSSRVVELAGREFVVGVLVVSNMGAETDLRIDGVPVGRRLSERAAQAPPGSIIMIVGTNAPMTSRQLKRVARRCAHGLGLAGTASGHGSGDFVIAFSNACRVTRDAPEIEAYERVREDRLSEFFRATVDATAEAILNSLLRAETTEGRDRHVREAIDVDLVKSLLRASYS